MNILFFVFLFHSALHSIPVSSGTLIKPSGEQIEVKEGTFLPSPTDKILAKKIEEKNLSIKNLKIDFSLCSAKRKTEKKAAKKRELEITDYHRSRYRELKIENESMRNWWNSWGRTLLVSVIATGAAISVTYFVIQR